MLDLLVSAVPYPTYRFAAAAAEEALAAANEAAKTTAEKVAPRVPKDLPPAKMMPWYQVTTSSRFLSEWGRVLAIAWKTRHYSSAV
jgi:hypothetical protein